MKKINSILMILAAAAGLTNCSKADLVENKEAENGGTVVYATTDAATKTTLSDDYNVLWSTGDQIKFVKDDATGLTYTFTLDTGSGSSSGTFKCTETPSDGTYTVYYPASYDGTNWPEQTYVSATDISGAPMKASATVTDGKVSDITFKNEGGILRYTVKGSKTIKSINVKAGSTLDVTLDCGTSGVALTEAGTVFNIALPADTYSNASLTFTATDNTVATKTASSFKVTQNVVSLATFESSALSFVAPPAPDGFVDLGVTDANGKPLYWAECNLGATKAEKSGDYFAWGETAPYYTTTGGWPASPVWKEGKTSGYAWQSYCSSSEFNEWSTPPYDATSKILLPAYDAATAANSSWRTPTSAEFTTLKNNSYWEWTDNYNGTGVMGVIVYKAKAAGDKGKYGGVSGYTTSDTHIFFPTTGYCDGTIINAVSTFGSYWSSTHSDNADKACRLRFEINDDIKLQEDDIRRIGFPVRPVTTEAAAPAPAATTGTAKATIGGSEVDVNWVQLWAGGPKFAEYNVGVTDGKAESYGNYYAWGGSQDKVDDHNTTNTGSGNLTVNDDTATKLWGSKWRMPTSVELEALINSTNCTVEWIDGTNKRYNNTTVEGLLCTGKGAYASNSVFLPAAGGCVNGSVSGQGERVYCWSSTPESNEGAYYLFFKLGSQRVDPEDRSSGYSVRAVLTD